jgi:hypothetical protein
MSAPRRICVIGNSSVGAVRAALNGRPAPDRYALSFFAGGGAKYDNIGLSGDLLVGAEVDSGGDPNLAAYDAFVLHGRLPASPETMEFEAALVDGRYSRAVQALARLDWRQRYKSWVLGLVLAERFGKPVLAISRNVFASESVGDARERRAADATLARLLAPLRYVPLPDGLFEDDGRVKRAYFANPVSVSAREGRAGAPDEWHYNRDAGALILERLLQEMDEAFGAATI